MRVFICIKQVPDTETRIRLSEEMDSIATQGIKWVVNPYDEFAIEEAISFKEAQGESGVRVTALTLGPKERVKQSLFTAMAMGVDDSILVDCQEGLDSLTVSRALCGVLKEEISQGDPFLIFTGTRSIDENMSATGPMLAQLLGIPHLSAVVGLKYEKEFITAHREIEGGVQETFRLTFPALFAVNKGLNKPRFASLPGIMKAKKKPIKELDLEDMKGLGGGGKFHFSEYVFPKEKPPCRMLEGDPQSQVDELVSLLREEVKIF